MGHSRIIALTLAFLLVPGILPGCVRVTVPVELFAGDAPLRETAVLGDGSAKIAQIDLSGLIADARTPRLLGQGPNPVDAFLARLRKAEEDPSVAGVVVRINSPGGTVTASDILHREIVEFRARCGKPVVASLGEVAASGGYYVALACDEIISEATTITASIGVIIPTVNISDGLSRIGVHSRAITSGPNKDLANPLAPMREAHAEILQGMVDSMYARFLAKVDHNRPGLSVAHRSEATDGRVMTGERAHEIGLVDRLGGLGDAFDRVRAIAGVERARLVKYHAEGVVVRTPYALTDAPGASGDGRDVSLIDLGGAWLDGLEAGRAYYVWVP